MRSTLVLTAATAVTAVLVAGGPAATAWTGEAYADGSVQVAHGTGTGTGTTDADRFGNLDVSARSVGGTKFLLPILNLLPYINPTSVYSSAYVSDGIPGYQVEAGHRYLISVTYAGLDVETSAAGNGLAEAKVWAQAAAGSDAAGHTLVAGSGTEPVTEDGTTVLEFEAHPTQTGPIGVQAQIQVHTSAKGADSQAAAALSGAVTDVQIIELD